MIEGLKITIGSAELVNHLRDMATHHTEKYVLYTTNVANLESSGAEADVNMTNDPIVGLRNKADEHQHKSEYFAFLAEHVIPDEQYRLSEGDLRTLEILRRYF